MWNRAFLIGFDNGGPGETMAFPDNSHAHFHHPLPLISFSFKCVQLSWIFSNVVQEHDMKYCPELVPPIQILHWKAKERKRERGTPESERNRWKSIKRAERMVPKKTPSQKENLYLKQKKNPQRNPTNPKSNQTPTSHLPLEEFNGRWSESNGRPFLNWLPFPAQTVSFEWQYSVIIGWRCGGWPQMAPLNRKRQRGRQVARLRMRPPLDGTAVAVAIPFPLPPSTGGDGNAQSRKRMERFVSIQTKIESNGKRDGKEKKKLNNYRILSLVRWVNRSVRSLSISNWLLGMRSNPFTTITAIRWKPLTVLIQWQWIYKRGISAGKMARSISSPIESFEGNSNPNPINRIELMGLITGEMNCLFAGIQSEMLSIPIRKLDSIRPSFSAPLYLSMQMRSICISARLNYDHWFVDIWNPASSARINPIEYLDWANDGSFLSEPISSWRGPSWLAVTAPMRPIPFDLSKRPILPDACREDGGRNRDKAGRNRVEQGGAGWSRVEPGGSGETIRTISRACDSSPVGNWIDIADNDLNESYESEWSLMVFNGIEWVHRAIRVEMKHLARNNSRRAAAIWEQPQPRVKVTNAI